MFLPPAPGVPRAVSQFSAGLPPPGAGRGGLLACAARVPTRPIGRNLPIVSATCGHHTEKPGLDMWQEGDVLNVKMSETPLASVFASGRYVGAILHRGPKGFEAMGEGGESHGCCSSQREAVAALQQGATHAACCGGLSTQAQGTS
jgi:hypothetical protein